MLTTPHGISEPLLFGRLGVEVVGGPPGGHRWQVGSLVTAASLLLVLKDLLDLSW